MHRFRTTRARLALLAAGTLLVTGGCSFGGSSGDGSGGGSGGGSGTTPAATAAASSGAGAVTAVASASPGSTAPADLPVLASRDASNNGHRLRVELNALQVSGQITRLTFTARNAAAADSTDRWQVAGFFADGIYQMASGQAQYAQDSETVDGIYLLDPVGAKRYLAARTATKACVCSQDLASTILVAGDGAVLSTVFAALPADVTKVDVFVPHFGTIPDVPVSR